jgi:hypothetical protein
MRCRSWMGVMVRAILIRRETIRIGEKVRRFEVAQQFGDNTVEFGSKDRVL